jgi:hypothetical protein
MASNKFDGETTTTCRRFSRAERKNIQVLYNLFWDLFLDGHFVMGQHVMRRFVCEP